MATPWSPAAQFLLAAKQARGSSLGDREYIRLMHDLLEMAIQYRMKFDHKELLKLADLIDFHTNVGVFRLLNSHSYAKACWYESSYAIAYQVACELDPWKVPLVYAERGFQFRPIEGIPGLSDTGIPDQINVNGKMARIQTKSCKPKVAEGLFIELPKEKTLFRCTAVDSDLIRFVPNEPELSKRKRLSFTRDDWAQMFS